jgi:thiamine biosynthesis lipoprotein
MGTVFSLDIRDPGRWDAAVAEVVRWLHRVDAVFSTYRADSDLSRLQRGEATVGELDPLVAPVLELCERYEADTDGAFSARPAGRIDPTGLVKGWAVEQASDLLRRAGSTAHSVNGGGDIQLAGSAGPGRPWRVGISDPANRQEILAVVQGSDLAVATSGLAERGNHIVDPRSGRTPTGLGSVTVVGPRLTEADVYATAAFARGAGALALIEERDGLEGLVIAADGSRSETSGFATVGG